MNPVLFRSLTATLISIAASLAIGAVLLPLMGGRLGTISIAMCLVCPLAIAFPLSLHTFRQKQLLREANEKLRRAHAELAAAHARLAEKASRDDLTGMLNRETFLNDLRAACEANDGGALLMIDADDFKTINDSHGHMVGDEALKALAEAIARVLGPRDVAGRIGGEEFAVLLRGAGDDAAWRVGERIRGEVEAIDFGLGIDGNIDLTVSIGGASLAGRPELSDVMRTADQRLYRAKRDGRNRIVYPAGDAVAAA